MHDKIDVEFQLVLYGQSYESLVENVYSTIEHIPFFPRLSEIIENLTLLDIIDEWHNFNE